MRCRRCSWGRRRESLPQTARPLLECRAAARDLTAEVRAASARSHAPSVLNPPQRSKLETCPIVEKESSDVRPQQSVGDFIQARYFMADARFLGVFRIGFGALLTWDCLRRFEGAREY